MFGQCHPKSLGCQTEGNGERELSTSMHRSASGWWTCDTDLELLPPTSLMHARRDFVIVKRKVITIHGSPRRCESGPHKIKPYGSRA